MCSTSRAGYAVISDDKPLCGRQCPSRCTLRPQRVNSVECHTIRLIWGIIGNLTLQNDGSIELECPITNFVEMSNNLIFFILHFENWIILIKIHLQLVIIYSFSYELCHFGALKLKF